MKQFGKYHLQAKIGAGGMAEVYLGRSFGAEGLEKQVVIKRIRPEFAQKARFVSMFIGEAKIAVSLNHPNVVQVYEFGCIDEDYYLAMEYVEGTDLSRLQAAADALSRPFPVADAIYVAIEIAKGLDYAHRKKDPFGRPLNIVHRDISPQNILISREGGVKLLDFGIAKAAGVGEHESEIKGKYSYMSPEQARGEVVDARSDIFSLGIVLWETLAGESLFPYTSAKETLEQVRSGATRDILDARDDIDESLAVILRKALEPYPEDRFETARDFQIALTRSLFATGTVADTFTLANFAGEVGGALTPDPLAMTSSSGRTQAPSSLTGAPNTGSAGVIDRLVGDTGGDLSGAPFETSPEQGRSTAITQPPGSHTEHGVEPPVHIQIERKDMVLLVGEVRGLEELRGASGYERWQQVLMDYIRMVEAIAFKNHAVIDRLGEQGFAIALGLPVSAENDAERAVRMALALVEAIEAMNINLAAPLQLAIGAVVGYAVLEQEIQKGSKTLHGHKFEWAFDEEESGRGGLYLAEALARSGMSREILLGGRILRRVQRHYQTEAIQKVTIDLDDDTVELSAHKLVGPKSGREQVKEVRHAYQKLFGRELALKNLRETYRRVLLRSRVQALLITGEQGVGKSTLVNEFLAGLSSGGARPRQVTLIRGVAELHDKETPFGSLRSLLMELLRLPRGADLRLAQARLTTLTDALLAGESEIDRKFVVHALTFLLGIKIVGNVIEDLGTASRREVLTRSLQQFIVALATHKPLLMALEDMHNVDQATLGFLSNALSSSIEAPIFILMTSLLPDEAQPGWSELLGQSGLRVEKLGELDARGARDLAEAMLPEALETEEVALAVVSRAGGNPLFIKELVELIAERGLTDPREISAQLESNDEGSWIPTTVEGLITSRIDRLAPGCKKTLQRCGLLGQTFDEDMVAHILPELGVEPEECFEHLAELTRRGFVTRLDAAGRQHNALDIPTLPARRRQDRPIEDPTEDLTAIEDDKRTWAFANSVTMDVAARGLIEAERAELHTHIADHLIDSFDDIFQADLATIAYHLDAAGRQDQAGEFYLMASQQAISQIGGDECLRLVDKALRRLDPFDELTLEALETKERALSLVGHPDERREILETLLQRADTARRRLQYQGRMLRLTYEQGDLDKVEALAGKVLEEARKEGDQRVVGSALRQLHMVYRDTGRHGRALEIIEDAIICFRGTNDIEGLWAAHVSKGITLRQGGRLAEALTAYRQALAIIEGGDFNRQEQTTLVNMGLLYANMGELDKARSNYLKALESIRSLGYLRDEASLLANLGHLHMLYGDSAQAHRALVSAVRMARRTRDKLALADALLTLGTVNITRGRLDDAGHILKKGIRVAREISNIYLITHGLVGLASLKIAVGGDKALEEALTSTREAVRIGKEAGLTWIMARGGSMMAQILHHQGKADEAVAESRNAVGLIGEIQFEGSELVLARHARLLQDTDADEAERARLKAHGLVQSTAGRIANGDERRTYLASPNVREVLES